MYRLLRIVSGGPQYYCVCGMYFRLFLLLRLSGMRLSGADVQRESTHNLRIVHRRSIFINWSTHVHELPGGFISISKWCHELPDVRSRDSE